MHNGHRGEHRPAVFLDRDGTINRERHHLSSAAELELLPGVTKALKQLQDDGFCLVVITNQSVIARGKIDEQELEQIHDCLATMLADDGVTIDGWYWCPHLPTDGCSCRKPSPELLIRAGDELRLDLARSWMVGDKLIDTRAGKAAGGGGVLVATGYGEEQSKLGSVGVDFDYFAKNLSEAASHIVRAKSRLRQLVN